MSVDHRFTWRPGKDCEAAILRGDKCKRVALVLDKLCRRQVTRPTSLRWMNYDRLIADHRFGRYHLLYRSTAFGPPDLSAKCQHFILIIDYRGAVDRS